MKLRFATWALPALVFAGCSGEAPRFLPAVVPVTGTVTWADGKPLSNAMVTFIPVGTTKGIGSDGVTDATGKYELQAPRREGDKGAPPGEYKVTISKRVMPDGQEISLTTPPAPDTTPMASATKELVGAAFNESTTLTATVAPTGGVIDFKVDKR